jgi:hypothetical protein
MMRKHLTFANVCSLLALLIAVGTGSAYAANTIKTSDIVNNQVYSADVRNDDLVGGGLNESDLRPGAVGSSEVKNNDLTGVDVRNQSGVDTCTHGSTRFGELCARVTSSSEDWFQAGGDCAGLHLRLPTFAEAVELSRFDLPALDDSELFWTDTYYDESGTRSLAVNDGGASLDSSTASTYRTVCVTTPTN